MAGQRRSGMVSGDFEVGGRGLATLHGNFVAHLLAFIEATQAGSLNRSDVNENVLATVLRHDEPETFRGVEPLDRTDSHNCITLRLCAPRGIARHVRQPGLWFVLRAPDGG